MTLYRLKTFLDIQRAILEELGIPETDTTWVNRLKREINIVYGEICGYENWQWLRGRADLQLDAYISAGTVTVTSGSTTITFSIAPAASQDGRSFSTTSHNEIYTIQSHTAGATTAELTSKYTGSTVSDAVYRLWSRGLILPNDCRETLQARHDFMSQPLDVKGFQDFLRIEQTAPRRESRAELYTTSDYVDPLPFSSVSGLPATATRASAGLTRTIKFNATLRTSLTDVTTRMLTVGDRIKITAMSDSDYNGEYVISSVSTTSNTDDTITYTGLSKKAESSTADTVGTILLGNAEGADERYRLLLLYPSLFNTRTTYHVDYLKEVKPLEDDDDEPLIPITYRHVLFYGGAAKAWARFRNPEESLRNRGEYQTALDRMAGDSGDSIDTPRIRVSREYLRAKRNSGNTSRRSRGSDLANLGSGGSSSQQTITGTANTVAVFDTDGELGGSSTISTTELSYIDGVTSNIQTQLSAKLGGPGSSTDNAVVRWDGTAGGTVQNSGVIVSDVNAVTGVTALTVDNLLVDGNTVSSSSGAINITPVAGSAVIIDTSVSIDGGAVDITGDLDVDNINVNGNTVSSTNTDGAINLTPNGTGAVVLAKATVTGTTASHVLINNGSGNVASEATLAKSRGGTAQDNTSVTFPSSGTVQATTPNNHGILVSGAAATATVIAPNASTVFPLVSGGASADPSWALLTVAGGGTGLATLTANNVILGNGTSTPAFVAPSTSGNVLTSNGTTWTSATPTATPLQSYELRNLGISTSVGSSALTVALKQADGSTDPSSGSAAVVIGTRSSTVTSGAFNTRSVTAALSMVVSSGSSLGHASGKSHYIYVYAIDNAGTIELAVSTTLFDDGSVITTTAEGGAGASDSNALAYSTTARSNVACRLLARLKSTQATAGTWATAIAEITLAPALVGKTELISARATGTPASLNLGDPVVFGTKSWDTHNAYSVSTGSFTAPRAGFVQVTTFWNASNANSWMEINVNAGAVIFIGATQSSGVGVGIGVVQVAAGDAVDVRARTTASGAFGAGGFILYEMLSGNVVGV